MTTLAVAIDACVLHDLMDGEDEEVLQKLDVISALRDKRVQLAVDYDRHIINEYFRVLEPDSLGRRFVTYCIKESLVLYLPGRLVRKQAESLTRQRFDPNDVPYVAVAQAANGLYVTSEEKHLRPAQKNLLLKVCAVRVVTLAELPKALD
jgi:hypothetical protein